MRLKETDAAVVVVTISGPTGSGKSRVALEIQVALAAAGVAVWECQMANECQWDFALGRRRDPRQEPARREDA